MFLKKFLSETKIGLISKVNKFLLSKQSANRHGGYKKPDVNENGKKLTPGQNT